MDPKDLIEQYQQDNRDIEAAEAEQRARGDAARQARQDIEGRFSRTLQSVIIPYLDKVKYGISKFEFEAGREAGTMKPVSLYLRMLPGGNISILRSGSIISCQARDGQNVPVPCDVAQRITKVEDLTEENVGLLVKWLLDRHKKARMPDLG